MKRPLPQPNTAERDRQMAARRQVLAKYPPKSPLGKLLFAAAVGTVAKNLGRAT